MQFFVFAKNIQQLLIICFSDVFRQVEAVLFGSFVSNVRSKCYGFKDRFMIASTASTSLPGFTVLHFISLKTPS